MMVEETDAIVITDVMKADETEMLLDCLLNNKPLPEDKTKAHLGVIEELSDNVLGFLKDNPDMCKTMYVMKEKVYKKTLAHKF